MRHSKILALLLSVLLIAGLLPAAAFAAVDGTDIAGHAQETALQAFIDRGYLKGYKEDGTVRPDGGITRAEFAAFVNRVAGYYEKSEDIAKFTDVSEDDWFYNDLAIALKAGYLIGASETEMNPAGPILAYEADLVVTRILGTESTETSREPLTRAQVVQKLYDNLDGIEGKGLPTEGTVYGTATLTYAEFYAGDVNSTASFDAVSSATTGKYNILGNMAHDFVSAEANAGGYRITGVKNVNVAVAGADAAAFKSLNPTFTATETVPAQYKTVTVEDGKAVYSATKFNVKDTVSNAGYVLNFNSHWGDYEIELDDWTAADGANHLRHDRSSDDYDINSEVQGIILETSDGLKVGLEHLQSIWVNPYEFSFNVSSVNAGNPEMGFDNLAELSKLMGKTLTKVTFIMPDAVYDYVFDGIELRPFYGDVYGTISADVDSLTLLNVPEVENGVLTVTYTTGSRRDAVKNELYKGALAETVPLDAAKYAAAAAGGTFSATIESKDYADISVKFVDVAEDGAIYALANIPYDKFYDAEGVTANTDYDAVSAATNKVGNHGKAGGGYHSAATVSIAEDGTVTAVGGENGARVEGVTWPVKASLADLKALGGKQVTDSTTVTVGTLGRGQTSSTNLKGAATLTEAPAYSYYILSEAPAYYMTLNADGSVTANTGVADKQDKIDVTVTYGGHWGDIQFDLANDAKVAGLQVNAMILTAEDGTSAGLVHLYNIWSQTSVAWKVSEIAGLDGKKLTNIRYYCNDQEGNYFIYDYPVELTLTQVFTGELSAEFTDENTVTVTGLPEDAENLKATVYFNPGGRGAQNEYITTTVLDPSDGDLDPKPVSVVDGKITLDKTPENGKTYTVALSSDNYIFNALTATFGTPQTDDGSQSEGGHGQGGQSEGEGSHGGHGGHGGH